MYSLLPEFFGENWKIYLFQFPHPKSNKGQEKKCRNFSFLIRELFESNLLLTLFYNVTPFFYTDSRRKENW